MNRVYLAGPMSGPSGGPDWNQRQFKEAGTFLTSLGLRVFNPSNQVNEQNTSGVGTADDYKTYLAADLQEIAKSDFVAVLPRWYTSRGATLEVTFATLCAVPVRQLYVSSMVVQNGVELAMTWELGPVMSLTLSLLGERMGSLGWYGLHVNALHTPGE